jgi:hypothetical protein
MPVFAEWDSFYVIVGSSAGALIGLQFVVMTLIAARPPRGATEVGGAFATPTVVHFVSVLLVSVLARVPWPGMIAAAIAFGLLGISGTLYALVVARRMVRQNSYRPDLEDWFFHAALPLLAYAGLAISAIAAPAYASQALFGIGAVALILLFTAIHNAWDSTAFEVFVRSREKRD